MKPPIARRAGAAVMLASWVLWAGLLCGCSLTFDGTMPDVPLLSDTPNEAAFVKLNQGPADNFFFVVGTDGAYWMVISESPRLRMTRLADPPATDEIVTNPNLQVTTLWEAFFLLQVDPQSMSPTVLTIRAAGQTAPAQQFHFPPGPGLLEVSGPDGGTFLYWALSPSTTTFQIIHRDGSPGRVLPVPAGLDPGNPQGWIQFDGYAAWLFTQDQSGRVVAHSTTAEKDVDLGVRPEHLRLDEINQALIYCDDQGLHSVAYDRSFDEVLDPAACSFAITSQSGQALLYVSGDGLRRVALDGSSPPQLVLPKTVQRILTADSHWGYVYTLDPGSKYVNGVSDGWLQGQRFMQRGRAAEFSADHKRLRWLEHAATLSASGDLMSGAVADALSGTNTLLLAHNVQFYEELSGGRLLALGNAAFVGPQNQVILIDEVQRTARVVADNADSYSFLLNSTTELLVTRLTGPNTFDLLRVPLPSP